MHRGLVEYPLLPPVEGEEMPSGRCPYCKRDTVFTTRASFGQDPGVTHGLRNGNITLAICGHRDCRAYVYREHHPLNEEILYDMYPPVDVEADKELPETVRRSFQEALRVHLTGQPNSTVQALGRVLQDATALMRPEGVEETAWRKKPLKPRIEALVESGALVDSLADWTREARLIRVLATHGDEYDDHWASPAEANEMLEFTKWLLRFVFVLPEQLLERRRRLAAEHGGPEEQSETSSNEA
jgi:hypothetical protein